MAARDLFEQALTLDPAARERLLAAAPEEDRREALSLLAALESGPGFLAAPLFTLPSTPAAPGVTVGPYELLRPIGSGGMSSVFAARRTDGLHRQEVAVKVLRGQRFTPELERRIRTEIALLARLDHPNIIRLLDCGADPLAGFYLVTEFVPGGQDLADFCRPLGLWPRLRVFDQVCAAVAYAHQNLIIHRDLKPSNILVPPDGAPKLLDFGISTLAGEAADTTATQHVRLSAGYASPEQIRQDPARRTATDVFSLGVILYELLAGQRPFDRPLPHETLRATLEEDPPRLTTRGAPADLEAIVFRALRKEPDQRYPTVDELRADLRRFLAGQPVLAAGDRFSYRARKFLRRHRLALGAAALVALLVTGSLVSVWRQYRIAQQRLEGATRMAGSLVSLLSSERRPTSEIRLVLDDARRQLVQLARDSGAPATRQMLVHTLLALAQRTAQLSPTEESGAARAEEILREAEALARDLVAESAETENTALYALALLERATLLSDTGRPREALTLVQKALPLHAQAADVAGRRMQGHVLAKLAHVSSELGQHAEAARVRRQAMDLARELLPLAPADQRPTYLIDVFEAVGAYAASLRQEGQLSEAIRYFREAVATADAFVRVSDRLDVKERRIHFRLELVATLLAAGPAPDAAALAEQSVLESRGLLIAGESALHRRLLARSLHWQALALGAAHPQARSAAEESLAILRREGPAEELTRMHQRLRARGFALN